MSRILLERKEKVVDPFKGIRTIVEELEKYNPK
jgi:hypothetical protein